MDFLCAISVLLAVAFSTSCVEKSSGQAGNTVVIENVNLISMDSEKLEPNQTVIIIDKLIEFVGPAENANYPADSKVIDGQGKFLIPGLCDMHMHIDHPDVLKVSLAFGVTTVVNYRGLPEHLELRRQSSMNSIFSPNIYTTGDYMEGYPATVPGFLSFDNPDDARISIREQKEKGYDLIKVYRNLDSLMHSAICDEAAKNDFTVVGHLSPDISLEQSLAAGQQVIAHAEELMYFFNNENDTSRIDELVDLLKKYDVTFTPNLTIFRSLPLQVENLDSINSQAFINYLHPALFQSWRKEFNFNHSRGSEWADFMWKRFEFLQLVTRELKRAGIQILSSTDAPTAGALPGIAVHNELQELVNIGFTPYEALRTATVEPGEFIKSTVNSSERFGMIKMGYRADMLLLENNPLMDIENTKTISGVMKNGVWYSRDDIDTEFEKLEQLYRAIDPIVTSIERAVDNEDVELALQHYTEGRNKYEDQLFLGYYTMWYAGYRFLYQNRELTKDKKRSEKAIKFYKMYLDQYPEMHGSHYLLGMAYKSNKDTTEAKASFQRSLDLHPFNPYAKNRLEELNSEPKD